MITATEKHTKSQLQAANRELQRQAQKLRDKQLTRDALTKQVKGKVRNYAAKDNENSESPVRYNEDLQTSPQALSVAVGKKSRPVSKTRIEGAEFRI